MCNYVIITDSTTDLTPDLVEELDLTVLPLSYTICETTYKNYPDGREMSHSDFYKLLRGGNPSVTTQIHPQQFIEAFEPILQEGKDILYIAFSSGLSGTHDSACMARNELAERYPERKIIVVDSLSASMGEGLLVYHAVKKKNSGMNIDELENWIKENRCNLCHWFTVDDLHHLKRGGRVSATSAFIGTALGIKPVLHVDDEGKLIPVKKVRGRKNSLNALVDYMAESCVLPENQVIFISHGDCYDDAKYVADLVKSRLGVKEIYINHVGPVIGAHSGPGTVALFYLGKSR